MKSFLPMISPSQWLLGCICLWVLACQNSRDLSRAQWMDLNQDDYAIFTPNVEQTQRYLNKLSPMLVGRLLQANEQALIAQQGSQSIPLILSNWAQEPGFAASARMMMEQRLSVSGQKQGIDYNMPGRLVQQVVQENLPISTILTASYCVDPTGKHVPCDSQAPYTAGVLTTRAYLASRASRFNLTRADTMLLVFACRTYPMEVALQPRVERTSLIPMFQAQTPEEQTDPRAKAGFGNGSGCYTCHGQFAPHAQLFVRFDSSGLWRSNATGEQDPNGELGRSLDGLFTSHFESIQARNNEATQLFGQPVRHLADAAQVLAESPTFSECMVKNLMMFVFDLTAKADFDWETIGAIATQARSQGDPSLATLMQATFANPKVIQAALSPPKPTFTDEEPQ